MASSPITAKSDLITYTVKSGGSPINDTYQVLSIYINNSINNIPYCELEIVDGSAANQDFPISDSETFVPGAEIEVLVGYENDNKSIFKGIVTRHSLSVKENTGPLLKVLCKDKAVKMAVGRKNAYYTETTDSSILSKLISDNGLSADVTSTTPQLKEVIQYYSTDWDFMLSRADINGMVVFAKDGQVSVKNPDDETDIVLTLTYGMDIYEFDADIDAENQYKSVTANAWDIKNQSVNSESATTSNFDIGNLTTSELAKVIDLDDYPLQSSVFLESDNLSSWAKAQATKSKYAKARGHIKFQGSEKAVPGKLLEIKGMGKRFNGKAFVSGVEHDISDGNWTTNCKIGLSPNWFTEEVKTEAPLAAGLLPGIQGLQVGKVKQINDDPDDEFRVLVTLPLIQSGDDGVWARLSSLYATSGAGAFFYPEVEDEVIVGFINNDPRFPIILGSVYSSGRAAPETPDEENTIKAFVSREQMKITFDEDKKIITITTPGDNKMIFDDEQGAITISDQSGNSIKMSESGIDINSASSININGEGSLALTANEGISATASGGDISLNALNISSTADVEFNIVADAACSITANGEVSISGGMVTLDSAVILMNGKPIEKSKE